MVLRSRLSLKPPFGIRALQRPSRLAMGLGMGSIEQHSSALGVVTQATMFGWAVLSCRSANADGGHSLVFGL